MRPPLRASRSRGDEGHCYFQSTSETSRSCCKDREASCIDHPKETKETRLDGRGDVNFFPKLQLHRGCDGDSGVTYHTSACLQTVTLNQGRRVENFGQEMRQRVNLLSWHRDTQKVNTSLYQPVPLDIYPQWSLKQFFFFK